MKTKANGVNLYNGIVIICIIVCLVLKRDDVAFYVAGCYGIGALLGRIINTLISLIDNE